MIQRMSYTWERSCICSYQCGVGWKYLGQWREVARLVPTPQTMVFQSVGVFWNTCLLEHQKCSGTGCMMYQSTRTLAKCSRTVGVPEHPKCSGTACSGTLLVCSRTYPFQNTPALWNACVYCLGCGPSYFQPTSSQSWIAFRLHKFHR